MGHQLTDSVEDMLFNIEEIMIGSEAKKGLLGELDLKDSIYHRPGAYTCYHRFLGS